MVLKNIMDRCIRAWVHFFNLITSMKICSRNFSPEVYIADGDSAVLSLPKKSADTPISKMHVHNVKISFKKILPKILLN